MLGEIIERKYLIGQNNKCHVRNNLRRKYTLCGRGLWLICWYMYPEYVGIGTPDREMCLTCMKIHNKGK